MDALNTLTVIVDAHVIVTLRTPLVVGIVFHVPCGSVGYISPGGVPGLWISGMHRVGVVIVPWYPVHGYDPGNCLLIAPMQGLP